MGNWRDLKNAQFAYRPRGRNKTRRRTKTSKTAKPGNSRHGATTAHSIHSSVPIIHKLATDRQLKTRGSGLGGGGPGAAASSNLQRGRSHGGKSPAFMPICPALVLLFFCAAPSYVSPAWAAEKKWAAFFSPQTAFLKGDLRKTDFRPVDLACVPCLQQVWRVCAHRALRQPCR